jgi:monoamine oxidase
VTGGVRVHCSNGIIEAERVILTPPPAALAGIALPLDEPRRAALSSVTGVPMMKAAFGFERAFWRDPGITGESLLRVTNPLRKIYLGDRRIAIYADSASAAYWEPLCERRAVESGLLWRTMARMLRESLGLPRDAHLPEPIHHVARFWKAGVHAWKLGARPQEVQHTLFAVEDCMHICSEAFSPVSGWAEAALRSADLLIDRLHANRIAANEAAE